MTINERADYAAFVPAGENRRETARLLVELANEHGIPQTEIQSTNRGFNVTDRVADLLYSDDTEVPETGDYTGGSTDKSVPATQTNPQTRAGRGDSTEGGNQNTKAENVVDDHGNVAGSGDTVVPENTDEAPAKTAPTKKRK